MVLAEAGKYQEAARMLERSIEMRPSIARLAPSNHTKPAGCAARRIPSAWPAATIAMRVGAAAMKAAP